MLKAIIVDDEVAALKSLELLIQSYCPNVKVADKGQSVSEGIELIKHHNPDIVFLDIEMPKANGFELLEQLPSLNFEVIFISAYNQYAVKAFKYSAIDYILKPIDIDELVKAVDKVSEIRKSKISPRERYDALFENLEEILPRKLVIPYPNGYKYIDLSSVFYVKPKGQAFAFYMAQNAIIEIDACSLDISDTLKQKGFFAFNNGVMVNMNKVMRFEKKGCGVIFFEGDATLPLECESKELFMSKLLEHNNSKKG